MLLEKDIINDGSAISKYFCEPLEKHRNEMPLTKDSSKMMIILMAAKDDNVKEIIKDISKEAFALPAIIKRQEIIFKNKLVDDKVFVLLIFITGGNIGQALMYLYCIYILFNGGVIITK